MRVTIKTSKNLKGSFRAEEGQTWKEGPSQKLGFRPHLIKCGCSPLDGKDICWDAKYSKRVGIALQVWGLRCMVPTSGEFQEIALQGTCKPKLMGRHAERVGMPLWAWGLEHTVSHQEGLSKVVTGSRPSLRDLQETACSGAQLVLSITEGSHTHTHTHTLL